MMIDHLMEHKFNHWDSLVRELTAQSLFNLTPLCPDYMAFHIIPKLFKSATSVDLNTQHGTLLSLGQLIHALCTPLETSSNLVRFFPEDTTTQLKVVIKHIFNEKFFRGSFDEHIRPAVCFFIKKLSMSDLLNKLPNSDLGESFISDCDRFIAQCIKYNKESVQTAVVETIPFYCDLKYKGPKSESIESSNLIDSFIKSLTETSKGRKLF